MVATTQRIGKWGSLLTTIQRVSSLLLVNVGSDDKVSSTANDGSFPPLGVISLATVASRVFPEMAVDVVDGQVKTRSEVAELIRQQRPDVVGLSVLSTSYESALELVAVAKAVGSVTLLGNDHASVLARQILTNQSSVDYIITADIGEYALVAFIEFLNGTRPIELVPTLAYRKADVVAINDMPELPQPAGGLRWREFVLDQIPVPTRTVLGSEYWESYLSAYNRRYGSLHNQPVRGITTMNRARGCARVRRRCTFCGIKDLSLRFSSPEMFWRDMEAGVRDVKADLFYEAFDSFSSAPAWLDMLAATRPTELSHVGLFVYTQAVEATERIVDVYRRIGVVRANMGLESGDTGMLKRLKGPRDSLDCNRRACSRLKEAGILIYGSLVLGGPGETPESLRNTVDFAKWLIDNEMAAALEAQPLYPDPGAITGEWLVDPTAARRAAQDLDFVIANESLLRKMPLKYAWADRIDNDEVSMDFNEIFAHVSWSEVMSATVEIKEYAGAHLTPAGSAFLEL